MSKYANNYSPFLFTNYQDWYDCFIEELHEEPPETWKREAEHYFDNMDYSEV